MQGDKFSQQSRTLPEKEEDSAHPGYSSGFITAEIHRMAVKERFPCELVDYLLLMAELQVSKKKDISFGTSGN